MTITEQYTAAASQAQNASEQLLEAFRQGTETFTEQIHVLSNLPDIDTAPFKSYFQVMQQAMDAAHEFTFQWIDGVNSFTGIVRDQARTVGALLGR